MKKTQILNYLRMASQVAIPNENEADLDYREIWIGSVGIRSDGAIVSAKNGSIFTTDTGDDFQLIPEVHAERRVIRKMDWGGILFVARVRRVDLTWAMSRPCPTCQMFIKSKGVKQVFYTINKTQFGRWYPNTDRDRIFHV